jgi:DNA repair protein RecO (recombination protein O)
MPTYLTDSALCLRVTDFSETSQIVALFTRVHGLLPLIAKGAKRSSKKNTMSGPLDLLTSGEVVFIAAKGAAELGTLAGWELVDHRTGLRTDLAALNAGMLAAEITTTLVHPHDPHPELFDELEATLQLLGTPQRPRALVAYAKAALTAAGYAPQFSTCIACGKSPPTTPDALVRYSPRAGGILCADKSCPAPPHSPTDGPTLTLPARIAIALDRLPAPTTLLASTPDRPADPAALLTAMNLLLAHIEFLTNKPLHTRYLLASIFTK